MSLPQGWLVVRDVSDIFDVRMGNSFYICYLDYALRTLFQASQSLLLAITMEMEGEELNERNSEYILRVVERESERQKKAFIK